MLIQIVPWLFAGESWQILVPGLHTMPSSTRVIQFHVPATFQPPEKRWIPREVRGRLIEFPARGVRKSA